MHLTIVYILSKYMYYLIIGDYRQKYIGNFVHVFEITICA